MVPVSTNPFVCVIGIVLFWWLQPYFLHLVLSDQQEYASGRDKNEVRARLATAAYVVVSLTTTAALGCHLHTTLQARGVNARPLLFIVLWYTIAMQFMRYLHLISIGPTAFRLHFGLTTWKEIQLFMRSAPTFQFLHCQKKDDDNITSYHSLLSSRASWLHLRSEFSMAVLDVAAMEIICVCVLVFRLGDVLPNILQAWFRVYIMGISTALLKLLLECPSYYFVLTQCTSDQEIRIFPIYNRPHLTQSPRELWQRWSVTAGYHLRMAYYEPFMKMGTKWSFTWRLMATGTTFLVNCLLHITWWSLVIKGNWDYTYWKLLFVYPLFSFAIQDVLVSFRNREGSKLKSDAMHWFLNLLLLWSGFLVIGEPMALAQGMNVHLTNVSRANLFLPPLPPTSA